MFSFSGPFQVGIYEDVKLVEKVSPDSLVLKALLHKGYFTHVKTAILKSVAGILEGKIVVAKILKSKLISFYTIIKVL